MGSVEDPQMQKMPKKPWVETPLIESKALSQTAGCRVFLKLENLQPSGSFKSRAVGNLVLSHATDPANAGKHLHFFIPSAGNAGLAVARASSSLGHPCTVAVPSTTKQVMISKLRDAGANVVQHGSTIVEASSRMHEIMDEMRGQKIEGNGPIVPIELHPFDHERIWEGVSTMVDELAYQLPEPDKDDQDINGDVSGSGAIPTDAIICSVGGGGLMNGIVMGIKRQSKMRARQGHGKDVHVVAAETLGASSLGQSMKEGSLVTLPGITSMATSLGAVKVANRTLENALHPPSGVQVHSVVMDDADAARGALRLADEQKLLVELACGVSVEAAVGSPKVEHSNGYKTNGCNGSTTNGHTDTDSSVRSYLSQIIPDFGPKSRVVVVVCGGSNVSLEMASEWRQRLDDGWGA